MARPQKSNFTKLTSTLICQIDNANSLIRHLLNHGETMVGLPVVGFFVVGFFVVGPSVAGLSVVGSSGFGVGMKSGASNSHELMTRSLVISS